MATQAFWTCWTQLARSVHCALATVLVYGNGGLGAWVLDCSNVSLPYWCWIQDEFTAMREQYMRGGEGFILVYSVTDRRSFDEVRRFKEMIDRVRNYEPVPIVVAGNKRDLEHKRQVSTREGEAMALEFGCPFFESSAALRHNVDESFYEIVRCIRQKETSAFHELKKAGSRDRKASSSGRSLFCCLSGEAS